MSYMELNGLFRTYSGACKSGAYFEEDFLPKLNGVLIESIWCPCDTTNDERVIDAKGWSFKAPNMFTKTDEINRFGFLPDEFKKLLGKQVINGRKTFVRHISFRTDSSGHASEDSVMTIYGDDCQFSVWYRKDKKYKSDYKYALTQHDPYVKKWLKLFNTELTVKHPKRYYWEFEKFLFNLHPSQGTRIQFINGYVFPDLPSKHWKPYSSQPIRKINDNQVMLFDEDDSELYYLVKVNEYEVGDWGLVMMQSTRDNFHYGRFTRFNNDKSVVRFTVKKVTETTVFCEDNTGNVNEFRKGDFYTISYIYKVQPDQIKIIENKLGY
jgi:hypothetical protein